MEEYKAVSFFKGRTFPLKLQSKEELELGFGNNDCNDKV
jgi:hypothetical protein